jgi:glycosyltransferase involved in cell wall biosynthesis
VNVLLLLHPGTNSRNILRDAARGVERAGHRVVVCDLTGFWAACERDPARKPRLMSEETARLGAFIKTNAIDASLAMWANGLLSLMNVGTPEGPRSFFDHIGCPHILFWLDAPHWAHGGEFVPHCRTSLVRGPMLRHIINNRGTAEEMTRVLGFAGVHAVPYGVCEETFAPARGTPEEFDLVFAAGPGDPPPTPAALEELRSAEPDLDRVRREAADAALLGVADAAAPAGPDAPAVEAVLRELVRMQLANRDEPMLARLDRLREGGMSLGVKRLGGNPAAFVRGTMLVRSVERFERAFTLAYLARRFRVGIIGEGDFGAWEAPLTRLGHVPHEAQAAAYARGRLGLNVMRWQDDAGLNLKCFEITASGVACLTTRRSGLSDLFDDGSEVLSFSNPAEAAARARELLESPGRRMNLAAAGRARTLRDHTWARWASDVLATVRSTGA